MVKQIYILDNFDSFTYNLVHYIESFNCKVIVERNNNANFSLIRQSDAIVFSPGPGTPKEGGDMMKIIDEFHKEKPMLGVCLGHQAIASYFGGKLYNLKKVYHGKKKVIEFQQNDNVLFKEIKKPLQVGLYHSWAVEIVNNKKLIQTANYKNLNMAFQHVLLPIYAVQFHPESILTNQGIKIIFNFLSSI